MYMNFRGSLVDSCCQQIHGIYNLVFEAFFWLMKKCLISSFEMLTVELQSIVRFYFSIGCGIVNSIISIELKCFFDRLFQREPNRRIAACKAVRQSIVNFFTNIA